MSARCLQSLALAAATLWLLSASAAAVAAPRYTVDRFGVKDGLPVRGTTSLRCGPDGMLWIGTFDGLVRYDGFTFRNLRRSDIPGLPTNRIVAIETARDGRLWILGESGEVAILHAGTAQVVVSALNAYPESKTLAHRGDDMLLGSDEGVRILTQPDRPVVSPPGGSGVVRMRTRADGSIRVFTHNGQVWNLTGDDTFVGPYTVPSWRGATGPRTEPVEGPDGALWTAARTEISRDGVVVGAGDKIGAMEHCGGDLWAADAGGLVRLRPVIFETIGREHGLVQPNLYPVTAENDGTIWVGSWGRGLARIHGGEVTRHELSYLRDVAGSPNHISALHVDAKRNLLWVGAGNTVCAFQDAVCRPIHATGLGQPRVSVRLLHADRAGRLWVGRETDVSVGTQTDQGWRFDVWREVDGGRVAWARALVELDDGTIMIGTGGSGVLVWDGERMTALRAKDGLSSNRIRALQIQKPGEVWVGTEDNGLCLLERGGKLWHVSGCATTTDGLADDVVHALEFDQTGRLWMTSNRGLSWVDAAALRAMLTGGDRWVSAVSYGLEHGLRDAEFNGGAWPSSARTSDGTLYFPSQAGLVVVRPGDIPRSRPPRVTLDHIAVDGETQPVSQPLSLPAGAKDLELSWTAPQLAHGDDVVFRYRLDGVNTDWRGPTARRAVHFTWLPPGDSTLRVEAGLGGEFGPALALAIHRPPTLVEVRWFPALVVGFILMVLWGVWRLRLRTLAARQRALEAVVQQRTQDLAGRNLDLAASRDQVRQSVAELVEKNRRLKAVTDELAEFNDELEKRALQLGAQVRVNESLAQRLRLLDEIRTRFVANASHELRTPLTVILNSLSRIDDAGEDLDDRSLDAARSSARRLDDLITQLLTAARADEGALSLSMRRARLDRLLRNAVGPLHTAAEALGVRLELRTPAEPVPMFLAVEAAETIVTNLVGNALKFTSSGGAIFVELHRPDHDDVYAVFTVADTGIGIAAEHLPHVFERFYQVEAGDDRSYGGIGIGLSLVRDLVERLGGQVDVASDPGRGTTFTVRLPRGVAHVDPSDVELDCPSEPNPINAATEPQPDSHGDDDAPVVLVVEDNPNLQAYLVEQFASSYRVLAASNGVEALELARGHRPAAVVSDVMMPQMDGIELSRRLRADANLAEIPILLVSAKGSEEDVVQGLGVADDYLRKPFSISVLMARLARLLERPKSAAEDSEHDPFSEADRQWLDRLAASVDGHLADSDFGVGELAREMAVSRRHLLREVRRLTQQGAAQWLRTYRLERARELLERGTYATVAEVAAQVGMSPAYFSRAYSAWTGVTPSRAMARSSTA